MPCAVTSSSFLGGTGTCPLEGTSFRSVWCLCNSSSYEAEFIVTIDI